MSDDTEYRFLPWVRSGAASSIDTVDGDDDQPVRAHAPVRFRAADTPVEVPVYLYGPGDVTGLDHGQVRRTDPAPDARDAEPNYFPAVELYRPDLPWLFAPARANAAGRLRPWLCLVAVPRQPGVTLHTDSARSAPVLEIGAPARPANELPELADSWAWAHAQVTGDADAQTDALLGTGGSGTLARLLCPRRLDPDTRYMACLVPTFDVGRRAGLGESTAGQDTLAPAWRLADDPAKVRLPVYYHWEFRTGARGDFESLVRLLEPRTLPAGIGVLRVDMTDPGTNLPTPSPDSPGAVLDLPGVLRAPATRPRPWPPEHRSAFQEALSELLDAPDRALADGDEDPVVAPPRYGRWHAGGPTVAQAPANGWFRQLNLDPRLRAVAAVGAATVRRFQEQLMASAWRQAGELSRANRLLQQTQTARSAADGILRRQLDRMPTDTLLRVTGPAHRRVRAATGPSPGQAEGERVLESRLAASPVPPTTLSPGYRRVARPRGPVARRAGRRPAVARVGATDVLAPPVAELNDGDTEVVPPPSPPAGMVSVDAVSDETGSDVRVSFAELAANAVDHAPRRPDFGVGADGPQRRADAPQDEEAGESTAAARFREAAGDQQHLLFAPPSPPSRPPEPLGLASLRASLRDQLAPEGAVPPRALARLRRASGVAGAAATGRGPHPTAADDDPLRPLVATPSFPQPMYAALRTVSPELLLPGLARIPADTVTLLANDADVVAAYLIGLNHEMSRELRWREFPTGLRGTAFRRFWDDRAADGGTPAAIAPIVEWPADHPLADQVTGVDEPLVILIRGTLLRRFPDAVIYAVPAVWTDGGARRMPDEDADHRRPQFGGMLDTDTTLLGFPGLTVAQARGSVDPDRNPGWFFVLEQQATRPRFGLDVATAAADTLDPPTRWDDMSWGHLAPDRTALRELRHVALDGPLPDTSRVADPSGAQWGADAAHMATVTLQRPVRVLIHASDMLPDPDTEPDDA